METSLTYEKSIYIYFFVCLFVCFLLHNQVLNYHPNLLQWGSKPVLSCKCDDNVINLVLAKKKKKAYLICLLLSSCEELTHWKRPWCWEGLGGGGEGDDRGWDGWMASLTRWSWVWVNSRSLWWTGRPGVLWFMGLQRIRHDWVTELNWTDWLIHCHEVVRLSL